LGKEKKLTDSFLIFSSPHDFTMHLNEYPLFRLDIVILCRYITKCTILFTKAQTTREQLKSSTQNKKRVTNALAKFFTNFKS